MTSSPQDEANPAPSVPPVLPSSSEAAVPPGPETAASGSAFSTGTTLREARTRKGLTLGEMSTRLRIREIFLSALESGQTKDLPGGTYAIGFLRSYAEALDLDSEEMVRRFRAEAAGELDNRTELSFPSPVSEGRIPGGAILFIGIILAVLAYGGWYLISTYGEETAEMVPSLPERLNALIHRPAAERKTRTDIKTAQTSAPAPQSATETASSAAVPDNEVIPPSEEDDSKAKPVSTVSVLPPNAPAPPMNASVAPPPLPTVPKAVAETPTVPTAPSSSLAGAAQAPAASPQPATGASPATEPAPADGRVIGQENTDSRITLRAEIDDCWVQVREMDGQLLLSRLMRKGESFRVPNRSGLTMMVGNAGALEVVVDGTRIPSLGAPGQVRRDIHLDAEKLKSATN